MEKERPAEAGLERPRPHEEKKREEAFEIKKSPEGRPDIEVTFLYTFHRPEYADQIWKKVKDADLILFEWVESKAKRASTTRQLDKLFSDAEARPDAPYFQELKRALQRSGLLRDRLTAKMLGTEKRLEFIDVTKEEPEYIETKRWLELRSRIVDLVAEGKVRKALELYPTSIKLETLSCEIREDLVAEQLKERFKDVKEGKKIAVIQGAPHTRTYHTIKREGPSFRLRFGFFPTPFPFTPEAILVRRRRFFPEREISQEDYLRSFVSEHLIMPGVVGTWPKARPHEICSATTQLARQLRKEEVEGLLDQFSRKQSEASYPINKSKLPPDIATELKRRLVATIATPLIKELAKGHGIAIKTEAEENSEKAS